MARRWIYWICQIVAWFVPAAGLVVIQMLGSPERDIAPFAISYASGAALGIAWTHGYRQAIRRWRWIQLRFARLLPRILVASLVLGIAVTASVTPVWRLIYGPLPPITVWAPGAIFGQTSGALLWSVVYFGVHYVERAQRLELEQLQLAVVVKDAQLHGLMAQLQPHFLFNCLNSVRALIVEDPVKAQATVTELSSLLRYSLQATSASTVPLATELAMVRTYLALETVRFDERLRSEIEVGDGVAALPVPALLVQSLVENGVKHGIERTPAGGTIRVAAWRGDGALRIRVANPGRLGGASASTQIGLANARERLRLLYGPAATIALDERDRIVTAEVSIPLAGDAAASRGPA